MTKRLSIQDLAIGQLTGVTLRIDPGEIVCLSGVSGSGKSRLLRAIADLDSHEGEVRLNDTPASAMPADQWRRAVMLVPAESRWWDESVRAHCGEESPADLEALGLEPSVLDWPVSRLSSGEKQRLALYRALSFQPRALLLDEPTANLDETSKHRVEQWLCERIRRDQLPTLWVAHDPEQIRRVASAHYMIKGERVEVQSWN